MKVMTKRSNLILLNSPGGGGSILGRPPGGACTAAAWARSASDRAFIFPSIVRFVSNLDSCVNWMKGDGVGTLGSGGGGTHTCSGQLQWQWHGCGGGHFTPLAYFFVCTRMRAPEAPVVSAKNAERARSM